jgi:hypothetical protein
MSPLAFDTTDTSLAQFSANNACSKKYRTVI